MRKIMPKDFYIKTIADKGYNYLSTDKKMNKLTLKLSEERLFQVKSAIVFLSRYFDEIDSIIDDANSDVESILIAATVKEERG